MNAISIDSLAATDKPKWAGWLFSPFTYVAGGKSLIWGMTVILASGLAAYPSHSHFDGVLDFHSGFRASLAVTLAEGFIDWLALAIPLFFAGMWISSTRFRAIDLFGTQALARWPSLLSALVALLPQVQQVSQQLVQKAAGRGAAVEISPVDGTLFAFAILIMLIALCWMVWLMYRAFSISCNVRGWKAVAVFIGSLLIGEIVSKIAIGLLLRADAQPI